jgi:hypothetical protein
MPYSDQKFFFSSGVFSYVVNMIFFPFLSIDKNIGKPFAAFLR